MAMAAIADQKAMPGFFRSSFIPLSYHGGRRDNILARCDAMTVGHSQANVQVGHGTPEVGEPGVGHLRAPEPDASEMCASFQIDQAPISHRRAI